MAAGTLAAPGTKFGPCLQCTHVDCAESRRMATALCLICAKPIGYETRFYRDGFQRGQIKYKHAACVEDAGLNN